MSQPWFRLVDSDGNSYKGHTAEKIPVPLNADVSDLRKAIQLVSKEILGDITLARLKTFKNKNAFKMKEGDLSADSVINGLGSTLDDAIVILVPPPLTSLPSAEGLILSGHFVMHLWAHTLLTVHAGNTGTDSCLQGCSRTACLVSLEMS
jgi:hypothetical protein